MDAIVWSATAEEAARSYPADDLVTDGLRLTRAIGVRAPAATTWRWLCQIAVAPYTLFRGPRGGSMEERSGGVELRGVGPTTGSTTAAAARRSS